MLVLKNNQSSLNGVRLLYIIDYFTSSSQKN